MWLLGCYGWLLGHCYVVAKVFYIALRLLECFGVVAWVFLCGCWNVLGGCLGVAFSTL